ncbi:hypothetical protein [Streptomyces sp. NBC_00342]|uniref:hypothetical protein n=1 Tax=Streptomyces sp. NBC_00342 TaxID=2975718 RepID=UPI002E2C6603|nr:hypothetical protein [Streptomyces sp. NBC_00342]
MSTTNLPDPDPPASVPSPETGPAIPLWGIISLITGGLIALMLIGAGTLYMAYEHPSTATPLTTAGAVVGGIVTVVAAIAAVITIIRR